MESVLLKANLVNLSTGQYWLKKKNDEEKGMSDREGDGHKAVLYKSHFPPLRHSVVRETPLYTQANKPRLQLKDQTPVLFIAPRQYVGQLLKKNAEYDVNCPP